MSARDVLVTGGTGYIGRRRGRTSRCLGDPPTMAITRAELLDFLRGHSLAVQASMMPSWPCFPQAAVVGIAVSERFEIVFDTLESTRKVRNLRTSGRIAFVIGGLAEGDERTVPYEGFVEEPRGEALERAQRLYFQRLPKGRARQHSPGIV